MSDSDDGSADRARRGRRQARREDGEEPGGEAYGMTAFNMDDEKDEGHFDEAGNFVWNAEDKKVQEEAWLEDISEEQMDEAMHAKSRREYRDEQGEETMTEETAKRTLATLLNSRETVLQALQRLGSKKRKNRGTKRKQSQLNGKSDESEEQTAEQKEQFDKITEAADFLMRIGEVDVYSEMKEEFIPEEELLAQRQTSGRVRFDEGNSRATPTAQESKSEENPPSEVMWEYKGADGQVHGPFPTSSFIAWQQQGYFKGDSAVEMRRVLTTDDGDAKPEPAKEATADKPEEKISAEQELLNDFEDSEDEDEKPESAKSTSEQSTNEWVSSDSIDFSKV